MSEGGQPANDNTAGRRIRDGLATKWANSDLAAISTDETLLRLAEARDKSSAVANRFMLFGALGAFLYLLKLEGIANDLEVGDYSLADLPFGLFVTAASSLVLSLVAIIRFGDSRGFDRQLRLACERRFATGCHAHYSAFPNTSAFGESFTMMANVAEAGIMMATIRFFALTLIVIFLVSLMLAPAISGFHYIGSEVYKSEGGYETLRFWLILILSITNALSIMLMIWTRFIDEG